MRVRFPLATPAGVFLCLDFFIQKTRISHVFENAGRMRVAQRAGREAAGELPLAAASPIGTGQVAGAGATGMPFPIRTEEILRVQIAGLPKEDRQLRLQALCQQGGKQSPFDRRMGWGRSGRESVGIPALRPLLPKQCGSSEDAHLGEEGGARDGLRLSGITALACGPKREAATQLTRALGAPGCLSGWHLPPGAEGGRTAEKGKISRPKLVIC